MKKITLLLASFAVAGITQAQLANNGLENWRTYAAGTATNLEAPNTWFGIDSLVYNYGPLAGATPAKVLFKDSSAKAGTYAAKMVTTDLSGFVVPGILVSARPDFDIAAYLANPGGSLTDYLSYSGGTPVTQRYTELSAWVKYIPVGSDEAVASILAVKSGIGAGGKDSVIGSGSLNIVGAANYTKITVPVTYLDATTVPDKVIISFSSSDLNGTITNGSVLYVDEINISNTTGVKTLLSTNTMADVFPNPAVNEVNFRMRNQQEVSLKIYGMNGMLLNSTTFTNEARIATSAMPTGTYFYQLVDVKNQNIQQGKFNIVK